MYAITGATGHTGRPLVELLLENGERVRAIGRSRERMSDLVERGAEPAIGRLDDPAFVRDAFSGARAVYAMIPPAPGAEDYRTFQVRVADAEASAVRENGVRYAVTLSSVGAHLERGTGPVEGLHDLERRFDGIEGLNVVHLRPTFFMENLLAQIPVIRAMGVIAMPVPPEMRVPLVASRDIAAVAAERLLELDFEGKTVQYILGPEELTYPEIAAILGEAIGRPDLRYVQIPFDEMRQAMIGMGMTEDAADDYVALMRGLVEGRVLEEARRTPESTTPTTLRDFAAVFAAAYEAAERESTGGERRAGA